MSRGFLVLLAGLVVQVCLGGVYAWSVFVPRLVEEHNLSTGQTQAVFGVTIAVFTITMVYAGRVLDRVGPRLLTLAGGACFTAGYLAAAGGGASLPALLAGVGVLGGAGIGLGYVCPLTTAVRWFPRHKGLVTGVTVAGFGAGALLLSALVSRMEAAGAGVPLTFAVVGVGYGTAIAVAGLLLRFPETTPGGVDRRPARVRSLRRQPAFWRLAGGMFAGTFAGLMVVGNLKPMGLSEGVSATAATFAVSAFAVGNAVGRISWGWLHDRLGSATVPASLAVLALTTASLPFAAQDPLFVLAAFAVGVGFGSCFVLYAAEVASLWGGDRLPDVYPRVFLAYGVSGVLGPLTGGMVYDATQDYASAVVVAVVLAAGTAAAWLGTRRLTEVPEQP
jgi:OFA family oxalate/formate antiporter-like MFS transporter